MSRYWHRIRRGHWPEPGSIVWMNDDGTVRATDRGCHTCLRAAALADSQRPWGKAW